MDGEFDMEQFYWNVVDVFEDSGEFGDELLAWWDRAVFGTSRSDLAKGGKQLAVPSQPSSISLLKAQRAAKRKRLIGDQGDHRR